MKALLFLIFIASISALKKEPRVIIIGAGSAGIAAASGLLQNNITDVIILEAEDRIGGRVYSKKIGDYIFNFGAQTLSEDDDLILELLEPYNLLSSSSESVEDGLLNMEFLPSSDVELFTEASDNATEIEENSDDNTADISSWWDYIKSIFTKDFNKNGVIPGLINSLIDAVNFYVEAAVGINSTTDIPFNENLTSERTSYVWKEGTYETLLELLMKKYPDPEDELPIVNKTLLNKRVDKINYNGNGPVTVTTTDGDKYTADHVICTVSLGVLKSDHEKLFDPPLPEEYVNSIENIEFAHEAYIFLYYDEPWWTNDDDIDKKVFYWTEKDRKEIENDPEKKWTLGVAGSAAMEYRPKLLALTVGGAYSVEMEEIPEEIFKNQTKELIHRFFRDFDNITEPNEIMRTLWNTNENFRGTSIYYTFESSANNATFEELAEPIMRDDIPILQFAGEATEFGSTVNGAILSGFREAIRLIDLYEEEQETEGDA